MTHYAIIKGIRLENKWMYSNNDFMIDRMKTLANKYYDKDSDYPSKSNDMRLIHWEEEVMKPKFRTYQRENGEYIEWQGNFELDILHVGCLLYVPTQDKYFTITKVEANPNGEVTYYVDLKKVFDDTLEYSRLKAVDNWFVNEYPEFEKFSDLVNSRYDQDKYVKEFNDFIKDMSVDLTKIDRDYYSNIKEQAINRGKRKSSIECML